MIKEFIDDCDSANIQGTQGRIYAICGCDVDVFPGLKTTTLPGDSVTLDGAITPVAGKFFNAVDVLIETGNVKHELIGPNGSQGYRALFDFKVRATNATALEFALSMLNQRGIWVIPQNDGTKRVIGSKDSPAILTASTNDEGMNGEQDKAYSFSIRATNNQPAPYYEGTTPTA